MPLRSFSHNDIVLVGDALEIAEDATGNFFKFSLGQWKRHRYDVRTLSSLRREEIRPRDFALLKKGLGACDAANGVTAGPVVGPREFYLICLQDHTILSALKRDQDLALLSLLVYVFTHELVHIVRFCSFKKRFEVTGPEREKEEKMVHATTYEILRKMSLPKLSYILDSYKGHRITGMALS
jgi:hypothetical protein